VGIIHDRSFLDSAVFSEYRLQLSLIDLAAQTGYMEVVARIVAAIRSIRGPRAATAAAPGRGSSPGRRGRDAIRIFGASKVVVACGNADAAIRGVAVGVLPSWGVS